MFRSLLTMTAKIIDGKRMAEEIKLELRAAIERHVASGNRKPCLKAILVGENPASQTYVRNKMIAAQFVGIDSETINLPATITEIELIDFIELLNKDPNVDGILVQLPVPESICERNICNAVHPSKDVDGFNLANIGKLCLNMDTFIPATALGVVEMIKRLKLETKGKNVVVCGRSKNVGLPIAMLLHSDAGYNLPGYEATTSLCHRNTPKEQLNILARNADIIISATGVVGLIQPDMVKPGACVIDVGITRITKPDGTTKLVGDVDYEGVSKVAAYITPVPGGVGPMTVAMLMHNTYKAAVSFSKLYK